MSDHSRLMDRLEDAEDELEKAEAAFMDRAYLARCRADVETARDALAAWNKKNVGTISPTKAEQLAHDYGMGMMSDG